MKNFIAWLKAGPSGYSDTEQRLLDCNNALVIAQAIINDQSLRIVDLQKKLAQLQLKPITPCPDDMHDWKFEGGGSGGSEYSEYHFCRKCGLKRREQVKRQFLQEDGVTWA